MLTETDFKQIKNMILSFYRKHKYFPFVEDLQKEYKIIFPTDLDEQTKDEIDEFVNTVILEEIWKKDTKWAKIMKNILTTHSDLWKEFRKQNSPRFFNEEKFQQLWQEVEILIDQGESKLVEKLVGARSIGIWKASDAFYDMVYAIFPQWNQIR